MLSYINIGYTCLKIIFLACTAYFLYTSGYNSGMSDCRIESAAQMKQIRDANEAAISSARLTLLSKIENLQAENKRLEDEISTIDKNAIADPDANTCGISVNSVRRLNAIR